MYPKSHSGDQESLQADVMRFMAIIALSLVAIMSLVNEAAPETRPIEQEVRPTEPPLIEPEPVDPVHTAERPTEVAPLPEILVPAPAPPEPVAPAEPEPASVLPVEPTPIESPPREVVVIEREKPIEPAPELKPVPERKHRVVAAPPVRPEPAVPDEPVTEVVGPAPAEETQQDEGLQLRFQSERAFLGLVARGEIDVYAYRPGEVLHLDRRFALKPSRAPGEVYNLAVATVPDAIRRGALDPAFTWAVALPATTRREIQRHIERRASGVIEIQSSGAVRHVPSR